MLRAIIVDDEELCIMRLNRILSDSGEIHLCATFQNPLDAYAYVKENPVHVAFLDIFMPEIKGVQLSDLLRKQNTAIDIVFVTGYDDYAVQAFEMNALDYLMKPVTAERVSVTLDKLRVKHRGIHVIPVGDVKLTEQEMRVIVLLADGLSNKGIAERMNIAAETVKWHIKNIYRKLNVGNRVQVLRRAKELNMLR